MYVVIDGYSHWRVQTRTRSAVGEGAISRRRHLLLGWPGVGVGVDVGAEGRERRVKRRVGQTNKR